MSKIVLSLGILIICLLSLNLSALIDDFPWTENFAEADISSNWPLPEWDRAEGLLEEDTFIVWDAFGWSPDDFANLTTPENISARINIYGTGRLHWLVTPSLSLDNYSDYFLSFDYALTQYGNNNPGIMGNDDKFCVVVSPDDGETWSSNDIVLQFGSTDDIPNTAQNIEIPLNGYTGLIRIGFYGESLRANEDIEFFVDNVHVRMEEFIPEPPQNLTYTILENDVELIWDSPENNTPDSYKIYLNEEEFASISSTDTSFTINNLPVEETEVYVTAIYGETESEPSNIVVINMVSNSDDQIPAHLGFSVFPNPIKLKDSARKSNPTITFNLIKDSFVNLSIYNLKGQKVKNLINENLRKGEQKIQWDGLSKSNKNPISGIYLIKLEINHKVQSKKITILP